MPPSLSIIIPVLNEAEHIVATLNDLSQLRRLGHEIVVVDGGSRDQTVDLASTLADKVVCAPKGRARQMNAGANASSGDVLWFVHADTRVPSMAAEHLIEGLDSRHVWGRFDIRLSGKPFLLRVVERMMNLRSCLTGIATGDQGIFVRRDSFDAVGGFLLLSTALGVTLLVMKLASRVRSEDRQVAREAELAESPPY